MKKLFIFITLLIFFSRADGLEKSPEKADPASLIPQSAILFAETSEISKSIQTADFFINKLLPEQTSKGVIDWQKNFKARTGVDLLDAGSLSKSEVDVSRPLCMAYLFSGNEKEKILLLIPVKNEKTSPLKFVDILKKYNQKNKALDLNPAVTQYKGLAIYQVLKDIFFTATDGYLVLGSSGELIKEIIDKKSAKDSLSLATDPNFISYREKNKDRNDLDVYMKKEFIDELNKKGPQIPEEKKDGDEKLKQGRDNDAYLNSKPGLVNVKNDVEDTETDTNTDTDIDTGAAIAVPYNPADLDFIEYISLGLRKEKSGLSFKLGASLKKDAPAATVFAKLLKTGATVELLSADGALSYHYVAADLQAIDAVCKDGKGNLEKLCARYAKAKEGINKDLGFDISKDFIPYFNGYVNIVVRKAKVSGNIDNFILFVPMNNEEKCQALWKKLRSFIKSKNKSAQAYGEEKIDNMPSFWFKDMKGNKVIFIAIEKGLYILNNSEFLRVAINNKINSLKETKIESLKDQGDDIFMASYIKIDSESYVKALLMLLVYQSSPNMANFINKINDITLTGKRVENYFSIYFSLTLAPGN